MAPCGGGGAIDFGFRYILASAVDTDWVLLINNDTMFDQYFVQSLLRYARYNAPAAVQATVVSSNPTCDILSVGPIVDSWCLRVVDVLHNRPELLANLEDVVEIDALSGRGVLYPVKALRVVECLNSRLLPHYFADYELSIRVKRSGFRLYSVLDCHVVSTDVFGNAFKASKLSDRFFSVSSPEYFPSYLRFWWTASNFMQKITFPARLFMYFLCKLTLSIA